MPIFLVVRGTGMKAIDIHVRLMYLALLLAHSVPAIAI